MEFPDGSRPDWSMTIPALGSEERKRWVDEPEHLTDERSWLYFDASEGWIIEGNAAVVELSNWWHCDSEAQFVSVEVGEFGWQLSLIGDWEIYTMQSGALLAPSAFSGSAQKEGLLLPPEGCEDEPLQAIVGIGWRFDERERTAHRSDWSLVSVEM